MKLLLFYWLMLLVGYILGGKIRENRDRFSQFISILGPLVMAFVMILVFIMGARMGANEEVISNLHTIGLEATFLTIMVLLGSVLSVVICRKLIGLEMKALKSTDGGDLHRIKDDGGNKMSLAILLAVVVGLACGYLFVPRVFSDMDFFNSLTASSMIIGISIILLFVGMELGLAGNIGANLKAAGWRVLIFPVVIIIGSLAGGLASSFFLPISAKEALAISSGFGWYTLAPIIISEHGYIMSGAISFLHNVIREFGGIILMPIVARKIGCIEAASLPGVSAMDITLPLLEQVCGEKVIIYSFLIGLLQSAMVPLLVPLFISL